MLDGMVTRVSHGLMGDATASELHALLLALGVAVKSMERRAKDAPAALLRQLVLPVLADTQKHNVLVRAACCWTLAQYAQMLPEPLLPQAHPPTLK